MHEHIFFTIRQMHKEDLAFAAQCTTGEGWVSESLPILESFFLKYPQGCLLAEENGRSLGICIVTPYGSSGFVGELIVRPDARGRGIGAQLLNHGVQVLKEAGGATVYLDGVIKAVGLYERNGFHKVSRSWRFSGHLPGRMHPQVRRMAASDLDRVSALDKVAFSADRSFFLKRRFELFPQLSFVRVDEDEITGYILGRGGEGWVAAGPWVVAEAADNPLHLLDVFALEAAGRSISIGILDVNQRSCDLVRSLGFVARTDSPWRMASGNASDPGTSLQCYAVGSAAKG